MTRHSTDPATVTYSLLRAFVDELARCGMRAACTSPGSRCAPLVLTLASEKRLSCFSHVDERCAGFFALGLAKASGLPVAVTCTSGTAAAELLPAAIEAREARVPLLLLTADRPPELRENGAGQAIDQLKLFGSAAKWFFEVDVQQADAEHLRWMRTLACRAYWTALEGPPGAVHLNFPLREPLVTDEGLPADPTGRGGGGPYVRRAPTALTEGGVLNDLAGLVSRAWRGVLVAGRYERPTGLGEAATAFAVAAGWPLLADPLSGARRGQAAIAHYDALLRDERFGAEHVPDLVLRVGDLPVSKPLRGWLAGLGDVTQIAIDPDGAWQDPASVLSHTFALEPATALARLAARRAEQGDATGGAEDAWAASWRSADARAAEAILGALGDKLSEPRIASELGALLPAETTLFVASSMPVRDIETFWPVRPDPPRVLCNRGANGIDGTVSSAFGAAANAARLRRSSSVADRRCRPRARSRWPAREHAPRPEADDRAARQQRWRHLRLPTGREHKHGARGRRLHTSYSNANRSGLRAGGRTIRIRAPIRGHSHGAAGSARGGVVPAARIDDRAGEERAGLKRATAPTHLERCVGCQQGLNSIGSYRGDPPLWW